MQRVIFGAKALAAAMLAACLIAGCSGGDAQPRPTTPPPARTDLPAKSQPSVKTEVPEKAPPPVKAPLPAAAEMPRPGSAEKISKMATRHPLVRSVPVLETVPVDKMMQPDIPESHGEFDRAKIVFSKPEASKPVDPAPPEPVDPAPPNTVVRVYYATDRAAVGVLQWQQSARAGWPRLAGAMALVTVFLMFWAHRRPGRYAPRVLAWSSLVATVILGGSIVLTRVQPETPDRDIDRMYGYDRGELELGSCEVSIPKDHRVGSLESPSVLRLEFREDPERHIVLMEVHPRTADEFYADLRSCVGRSGRKEAFVFIHGYNVGFETAARRTAQIAYDLKFDGAPIFYSWPSREGLLAYTVDETNVAWTVPHLKEFLLGVARQSEAKSVHLIAHSMGNRALTSALRELSLEMKADCPRFHEVVLTAPDVDADVFRRDLAPAIVNTADRVTLYASSNDEALIASKAVHGYRRAGDSGDKVVVVPGVDTVDVSEVDTSFIGHSYYGSNSTVLADLFELMHGSKPPDQRKWLRSMELGALKYWKFLRAQIASPTPPSTERL